MVFMEIKGAWMCLGVSGFSVPAVWSRNTILSQLRNERIVCTWDILDIKIPKPPNIRFPKIIGFVQFWFFWFPQRTITSYSLFGSPCITTRCSIHKKRGAFWRGAISWHHLHHKDAQAQPLLVRKASNWKNVNTWISCLCCCWFLAQATTSISCWLLPTLWWISNFNIVSHWKSPSDLVIKL